MLREIRRQQSTLVCSGIGVIVFGIWDIVSFVLYMMFSRELLIEMFQDDVPEEYHHVFLLVIVFAVMIVLLIRLLIRVIIGRAAIRYGHGGRIRRQRAFNTIAFIFALVQLYDIFLGIFQKGYGYGMVDRFMSLIVSITAFSIYAQLLIASVRLRRYENEMSTGEVS